MYEKWFELFSFVEQDIQDILKISRMSPGCPRLLKGNWSTVLQFAKKIY